MDVIKFDASELAEFADRLDVHRSEVRGAAAKAVGGVVDRLHSRAVDSAPVRSGELRDSITKEHKGQSGSVGVGMFYGHFIEFGTVKMAPQPFLAVHAPDAEDDLVGELADIIEDLMRR